jgi:hypothetical protein
MVPILLLLTPLRHPAPHFSQKSRFSKLANFVKSLKTMSRKSSDSMKESESFLKQCSSEEEFLPSPPSKSSNKRERISNLRKRYKMWILHSFLFSISILSTQMSASSDCLDTLVLWSILRTPPFPQTHTLTEIASLLL